MFSKSRNFALALLVAVMAFGLTACLGDSSTPVPNLANERAQTCTPGVMQQSSELWNICTRYNRLADPNHVSYMYLLGNTGDIIAEYQVIGKCTSTESQVTNPTKVSWYYSGNIGGPGAGDGAQQQVPNQQLDGSYGQNEVALYCFLDNASKTMIEFTTQFMWSDTPLPLATPPSIVIIPNGK